MTLRYTWKRVKLTLVRERAEQPYRIRDAHSAATLIRSFIRDDPREHFVAVYLDGKHNPMAVHLVHVGTAGSVMANPRDIFGPAMQLSASAIIVGHNHPSGSALPSIEDKAVTERLHKVADIVGVPVLDHVIIGDGSYYSFASEQLIPLADFIHPQPSAGEAQ